MRPILIVLVLTVVGAYAVNVESRLSRLRSAVLLEGEMQTTWTSGGQRRNVTTLREPGESTEAWQERHFQAVRDAQVQYPPD